MISDFFGMKENAEQAKKIGILEEKSRILDKVLELTKKLQANGTPANLETTNYSLGYLEALKDISTYEK